MQQQGIPLVDDEAPMRKLLSNHFKAVGYTVQAASDGPEVLKLIDEHALLLLDISLPGPNGLQVLEAVRRDAEIPVLVLSARRREIDVVEALNCGADDYVSKPFGIAELQARVKALLRRTMPDARGPDQTQNRAGSAQTAPSPDGDGGRLPNAGPGSARTGATFRRTRNAVVHEGRFSSVDADEVQRGTVRVFVIPVSCSAPYAGSRGPPGTE